MKISRAPAGGVGRPARCRVPEGIVLPILLLFLAFPALASDVPAGAHGHGHGAMAPRNEAPGPFRATTEKTFSKLMEEAMAVMDRDMMTAPQNGDPDHDFVTMMIPHHQGAIDMAKVLLLYGKDPELRNLAQQIITDQQYEINLMRAWLSRHGGGIPLKPQEAQPK